mgnify:CR=1 FL=1
MNKTTIEWVRNPDGTPGYTSNPFTGCMKRCSYCYAWRESRGRCRKADLDGLEVESGHKDDPFYPRFHPERLEAILWHKKPAGIFLCNRADWCAAYWPAAWQKTLWDVIHACPQHRFYLLTKQPQELPRFSPFPDNCWVGVTAEDTGMALDGLFYLKKVRARVKFMSFEPLNGEISLDFKGLDWGIIGQQTHPDKPPLESWVYGLVESLVSAGTKVFIKDNLSPLCDEIKRQQMPGG